MYVAIGFLVLVDFNVLDMLSFVRHGFWVIIQASLACNENLNSFWVAPAMPSFLLKVVTMKISSAFVVSNCFELPM